MARIVHIEDDAANRLLIRKLLSRAGHEVLEAPDGIEGVRLACTSSPDLVLVDLNIPGLDGFEVTLRLRGERSLRGVPIVAITAEGDRETSLAVGCDGFLQKPIDARTFARTIAHYLGGAREAPTSQPGTRLREQSQRIVAHLEEKVAELLAANERLRELDAARATFYRNVSHELATPMTPIVGYVRLLLGEELGPVTAQQRKALRATDECVMRLRTTIDNLLDVTGLETGRMSFASVRYDFLAVTRRVLAAVRPQLAAAELELIDTLPERPMRAVGDPDGLRRAMMQLLDNAIKYTAPGGAIGVKVGKLASGHYELCVADTGCGIAPDRLERIFDAFYQVDGSVTREHGGVGVGLAIARRLARGLGGDLRAVSPADETVGEVHFGGAAFYLSVARKAPSARASSVGSDGP
ncbi:MAG: hybrid sensor histidine kinase/response regulator [Deltaproteobacteria bacterium]|jgi:signal transduction histidine kinase|nr:hybrid sensor histidine kinase/response regulator [Deltaproteobacteria bacterium]MBW2535123.1 hybrid sensor histidine kinase/response regulator [Deltaproteobacteria bacterium]